MGIGTGHLPYNRWQAATRKPLPQNGSVTSAQNPNDNSSGADAPQLSLQPLAPGDEPTLQEVFEAAADYFRVMTARERPEHDAARREIAACAATEGREIALLRLPNTPEAVGAIGWWQGNPEPDVALLGMLMIIPTQRGRGLAKEAVQELERRLGEAGIRRLRAGVGAQQRPLHALLEALGFERMSIAEHQRLGLAGAKLALWEKGIGTTQP